MVAYPVYVSPHLAATCFGRSPSSWAAQPNSLKLTEITQSLECYEREDTDYVNICNIYTMINDELIAQLYTTV